jgi:glutathione S-transferase
MNFCRTRNTPRRFATGLAEWQQKLYVRAFPGIRVIMILDMQINATGAEAGRALTQEALDFVAQHSAQTGYLVGDRFGIADLTAATILWPTCLPPEYPVAVPEPRPAGWLHWLDRWQNHAGCDYVRRIYREHRGVSAALARRLASKYLDTRLPGVLTFASRLTICCTRRARSSPCGLGPRPERRRWAS